MKVHGIGDIEPELPSSALAVVHYGNYRDQEVWVRSGANIGNWYPLWGEFGPRARVAEDTRTYMEQMASREVWRRPPGTIPLHPTWDDVLARGPVVIVVPGQEGVWDAGWKTGQRRLIERIQEIADFEGPEAMSDDLSDDLA